MSSNTPLLDGIKSPINRYRIFDSVNGYQELKRRFYKTLRKLDRPVTSTEIFHQLLQQYNVAFEDGDKILDLTMRASHELGREGRIKRHRENDTIYLEVNL